MHRDVAPRRRRRPRLRGPGGAGRPRRRRQAAAGAGPGDRRPGDPGPRRRSSGPTTSPAAPSPSPTPAPTARSSRRRSSTSPRWRSSSTDGVKKRPVVVELPDGTDAIAVHPVGMLALTFDHRAFDGAYAAAFLARVKEILETRDWAAELSMTAAAGALARAGRLPGGGRPPAGAARAARPTTTCCCSSTRTSTRSACGPTWPTCSCRRRRSGPTGAGRPGRRRHLPRARASWSATRSSPCPRGARGRRRRPTCTPSSRW